MSALVIFSYRGASVTVDKPTPQEGDKPREALCALLASGLILLHRDNALDALELFDAIDFLGAMPSDEAISVYLTEKFSGFTWMEMP